MKPDRFMFHVYRDIDFFTQKPPGKGGDVAHATWPSSHNLRSVTRPTPHKTALGNLTTC